MPKQIKCPSCNKMTAEARYCTHCLAELPSARLERDSITAGSLSAVSGGGALTDVTDPKPSRAASKRIQCPKCQKMTFEARYCMYCHAELHAQNNPIEEVDARAIFNRARASKEQMAKLPLVLITVTDQLPDGSLPNIKKLAVQPGTCTFMVSQIHRTAVLQAGEYDVSRRGLGKSFGLALEAGKEMRPVFLCTVAQGPLATTFFLPDIETLSEEHEAKWAFEVEAALRGSSIRTADNLLGAATAQVVLRCADPVRLLQMFIDRKLRELSPDQKKSLGMAEDQQPKHGGLVGKLFGFPMELVGRVLFGAGAKGPSLAKPVPVTVAEFYEQIRMEFLAAVIEAVRNEKAERLYNTVEVRERVAGDLQRIMSTTFNTYGLKIERVSAFRFICPRYEELLKRRGDNALQREQLVDRKEELEIGREQRRMDSAEAQDVSHVETETEMSMASDQAALDRHVIKEARETDRDKDLLRAEQLQRRLEMDGAARRHEIEMNTAAEHARFELQKEKMRLAMEMHGQALRLQDEQQESQLNRRIRMLREYANLPPDSVLTIALAENPQLAAAYAASVQAGNQREQFQMQEKFRDELSKSYASNNEQYTALLQEAVKQWGQYQSAKELAKVTGPQQVINVAPQGQPPDPQEGQP